MTARRSRSRKGKAKGDPAAQIAKLGAKEVGPGAIVFRYNDKLYIVEGTPTPAPQAMKSFQDNWNVSYMKAMKDFQDNWKVSYMKDTGANVDPAYAKAFKDFQDGWNVSYMKAAKEFQDNWNTSYMKNFQDNWNTSYMKADQGLPGQLVHVLHEVTPIYRRYKCKESKLRPLSVTR